MYNSEKVIEQTLTNLFCYDFNEDMVEVLLIDDGSKDHTEEVIKKFSIQHKSLKYIKKKNGGIADARNCGIYNASGLFLFFHDHDDLFDVGNIADIIEILKVSQSDLLLFKTKAVKNDNEEVFTDINFIYDNKQLTAEDKLSIFKTMFFVPSKMILNRFGHIWATVIRSDFIKKNNIRFVTRCDFEDDFTFLLECLLNEECKISCHCIFIYKWFVRNCSESHNIKYKSDYMDRIISYIYFLEHRIESSSFYSYTSKCISNIRWKKTRDYLISFKAIEKSERSFSDFKFACKKYNVRKTMIAKTLFKKSFRQKMLCMLFRFCCYRLCYRLIVKS